LFLDELVKLGKMIISFVTSVRVAQLASHWTNCHAILYLRIFRESV